MADDLDKSDGSQEPEKPKKAKKSSEGGGLPIMKVVIIGVIVVVVNTLLVVLVFKFVLSSDEGHAAADGKTAHKVEKKKDEMAPFEDEEADFFASEKEKITLETGRITTNPKGSTKFCAISFSLTFRPHPEIPPEELKDGSDMMKKLNAKMKAVILNQIGALTIDELDQKRSTLNIMIKDQLKPIFKEYKLFLRDVLLTEYIVQG